MKLPEPVPTMVYTLRDPDTDQVLKATVSYTYEKSCPRNNLYFLLEDRTWFNLDYLNHYEILKIEAPNFYLDENKFTTIYEREPTIRIGEREVEFRKDSIKVGCTEVSGETIKKIYDKLFGEQNATHDSAN